MKLLGKAIQKVQPELEKYKNSSEGQRSESNITNLQSPLAFTMGHIPTKSHQFLISSFFLDSVQTDT